MAMDPIDCDSTTGGPAVLGTNLTGTGPGVLGESKNFNGVWGISHDPHNAGVLGTNDGNGWGVTGRSATLVGVSGESQSGLGVHGISVGSIGVQGKSTSLQGVYGLSHDPHNGGVLGINDGGGWGVTGRSANQVGVSGESQSGLGVHGISVCRAGVQGESTSLNGVSGLSNDPHNAGVFGYGYNDNGGWGVMGRSANVGVSGECLSGTCRGAMYSFLMKPDNLSFLLALSLLCLSATPILCAQEPKSGAKAEDKPAKSEIANDLPADKSVPQTMEMGGKTLKYTATVGTLPVKGADGKPTGEVVFTSYTMDGPNRPVTFAFNGGPGAASVYLNLGAIGPKRVDFGAEGQSASDPATLKDNPGTWLDFTDLVFVDPIGTGFSRSLVTMDESKKLFYGPDQDIAYLSKIVFDWLVKNGRLESRKYIVGESYGGYRGPRLTSYLQSEIGVALNGLVLVSPALAPSAGSEDISPIPWMITLPSIVAANYERQGKLTPENMAAVIDYTRGEYMVDLGKGFSDPAATPRLVKKVTELTGLDPTFVKQSGGRLETQAFLREEFRETGKLGSRYDPNVTAYDPFPFNPTQETNDPILLSIIAPTTTAMVDFVTRTVGWKTDARYNALSNEVNENWDRSRGRGAFSGSASATDLRVAVATDPKLRVVIAHGWADLSCPFMGSVLTVSQIPIMGDPTRIAVHEYAGGHMYYARLASSLALRKDVMEMVAKH